MENKIIIFNKEIEIKEYNGERVITAYDIAELHGRDVKVINQQFNNNRNKFVENEDYFVAKKNLIHRVMSFTLANKLQNLKEIILFTYSGYLLLAKTFNDELSWKIQKELVKTYFKLRELKDKVESGELEIRNNQSKEITDKPTELQLYNIKRAELMIKAAEMMAEKYGLYKFSAGSVGSICSTHGLKCEPYAYMHWNNDFQESGWRYFPEVIMKIWDIITSDEKKCKRYNILFIDDEDF